MLNKRGFTLLELLVSIFILSVGILGAYIAIQKSASIANYANSRLTAAYLAQEGIEIIRNIKDTNLLEGLTDSDIEWNDGINELCYEVEYLDGQDQNAITCLDPLRPLKLENGFYNYGSGQDTKFKRKVTIEMSDPDRLSVTSIVYWQDGTKLRQFEAWEDFYNWW